MRSVYRGVLGMVLSAAAAVAADDPLASFPQPTPEIEALVKTVRDPAAAAADKTKAWKDLQAHTNEGATTALVALLRDDNATVAKSAADALRQRDKAKVRETVLAALGAVPPEKWGVTTDREAWRASGLVKIVVEKGMAGGGLTDTVNVYNKNKKWESGRITVVTPNGHQIVGTAEKEITQAASQSFTKLCTKNDAAFKKLAALKGDNSLLLFEAPPPADRRLIQHGLAILGGDDAGRKAAAAWKKEYAEKTEGPRPKN